MSSGNGHTPAEASAPGAVTHEDIHDHPVTLARFHTPDAAHTTFKCRTPVVSSQ